MILLKGLALSNHIKQHLKQTIQLYHIQGHRSPKLVMILVGEDFASNIYVANKEKACAEIGVISTIVRLPNNCAEHALLSVIHQLNADSTVDGILVQLPLPAAIDVSKILDSIDPLKDVDGFHPTNIGLLAQGRPNFRSCTPYGIMRLLQTLPKSLKGMHAVIVGASNIVGKPMMLELLKAACTVTICHIATKDLSDHIRHADLLVSAVGKTKVIQSEWIKKGAIVIDAGINRSETGITGDVAFSTAAERAYAITPVPGGVGPMTVAMLLENTIQSYESRIMLDKHP